MSSSYDDYKSEGYPSNYERPQENEKEREKEKCKKTKEEKYRK